MNKLEPWVPRAHFFACQSLGAGKRFFSQQLLRLSLLPLIFAALIATVGCAPEADVPSPPRSRWHIAQKLAFDASRLTPDDPEAPGDPRPQEVRVRDGRVYTILTHLLQNPGYGSAGPSYFAVHDASTLEEIAFLPLVFEDEGEKWVCRNAGDFILSAGVALVSCAGDFDDTGMLMEVLLDELKVSRMAVTGGAPGALLRTAESVWMGNLSSGSLLRVALKSFEVLNGKAAEAPVELCPQQEGSWELVSALYLHNPGGDDSPSSSGPTPRAFAACFNGGTVVEFDALTGKQKGEPMEVGDGPQSFAGSGRFLFVVDNLGATLSRIKLAQPSESSKAVLSLGQIPEGIDSHDNLLAVANSGDGTLTFIDAINLKKLDSVNLKEPQGGTNYPWGVAFASATEVFVTLNSSNELVHLVNGLELENSDDSDDSDGSDGSDGSN